MKTITKLFLSGLLVPLISLQTIQCSQKVSIGKINIPLPFLIAGLSFSGAAITFGLRAGLPKKEKIKQNCGDLSYILSYIDTIPKSVEYRLIPRKDNQGSTLYWPSKEALAIVSNANKLLQYEGPKKSWLSTKSSHKKQTARFKEIDQHVKDIAVHAQDKYYDHECLASSPECSEQLKRIKSLKATVTKAKSVESAKKLHTPFALAGFGFTALGIGALVWKYAHRSPAISSR